MREEAVDLVLAQVSRMTDVVEEDVTSDPADVGLLGAGAVVPHPNGFPDPIQEFGVAGSRLTGDRNSGGRDTGSAHRWFGRRRTAGCWLPRLMWPKPALAESRDGVRRTSVLIEGHGGARFGGLRGDGNTASECSPAVCAVRSARSASALRDDGGESVVILRLARE